MNKREAYEFVQHQLMLTCVDLNVGPFERLVLTS